MISFDSVFPQQEEVQYKEILIRIPKEDVLKDVDAWSYKFSQATSVQDVVVKDGMASDSHEKLDAHLLERVIEYRDATLKIALQTFLAESVEETEGYFTYKLNVSTGFKDALVAPLKQHILRYLSWGALYDWYAKGMGMQQANVYMTELNSLEGAIMDLVRTPSRVKRPLQPFGPAKRGKINW